MTILWIIGALACAVSIINLVRMLIRSRQLGLSSFKSAVRPVLTIVFMLSAFMSIQISLANATDFARKTAQDIQQTCRAEKTCPASISGWDPRRDAFASETFAGALAKYRVLYGVSRDRKQFTVFLRQNIGRGLFFTGGVDEELTESRNNS
jgi:hypothetical protein